MTTNINTTNIVEIGEVYGPTAPSPTALEWQAQLEDIRAKALALRAKMEEAAKAIAYIEELRK